jgi:tetratricopeptide (TPR) repeat protein
VKHRTVILSALLLWAISFTMALRLEPWSLTHAAARDRSGSLLQVLFGDGRRLFANHFFLKADAYFHRGIYPGIFETAQRQEEMHMVTAEQGEARHDHDHQGDHAAEGPGAPAKAAEPRDWIARINQGLSPNDHEHLTKGDEREMLPWLQLAAELDPQQILVYTTTAFWLRTRLGRVDEAEQFLREGLRHNPSSPEILFDLGVLYEQNRRDDVRAKRLFELALEHWREQAAQAAAPKPDEFVREQILGHLAGVEERTGQLEAALYYLEALRRIAPTPEVIDTRIRELRAKLSSTNAPPPSPAR